jgi:hypothetical protein
MKVGEPLTRTLKLVARGSTVGQIPELNNTKIDPQLKAYNDQPVSHEDKTTTGIMASREEKIALIPANAGSYTLPAIQIPWFNTQTLKIEMATLPEMTLIVTGETADSVQVATAAPVVVEEKEQKTVSPAKIPEIKESDFIWKIIAIFSTAAWLTTLGIWFLKQKMASKKVVEIEESPAEISLKSCVKKLKNACITNDSPTAKTALLEWGKLKFNEMSLGAIATHCEARLRDEILKLNASLYAKNAEPWQGKELFKTFSENNARVKLATQKYDALKPLYKL